MANPETYTLTGITVPMYNAYLKTDPNCVSSTNQSVIDVVTSELVKTVLNTSSTHDGYTRASNLSQQAQLLGSIDQTPA